MSPAHNERGFWVWGERLLIITGLGGLAVSVFNWFAQLQSFGVMP